LNSSSVITIGCSVQDGWAEVRSLCVNEKGPTGTFICSSEA
jgi:hypothetical protein